MPHLQWNETDCLGFFAVEPTVEDGAVSVSYEVHRDGLRLLFTAWQYESVIQCTLFKTKFEQPLFTWAAYVRGEARVIKDKRGHFLQCEDCIIAPDRFWRIRSGDVFDRDRFPHAVTVTIEVDPDISIAFVDYDSRN